MSISLLDHTMKDGWRLFLTLPASTSWYDLRDHLAALPGVEITGFLTDEVTEVWIDLAFQGQAFSINNQHGEYWFFVRDPACPDKILQAVADHCAVLLGTP